MDGFPNIPFLCLFWFWEGDGCLLLSLLLFCFCLIGFSWIFLVGERKNGEVMGVFFLLGPRFCFSFVGLCFFICFLKFLPRRGEK